MLLFPVTVFGMISDLGLQREYSLKFPISLLLAVSAYSMLHWYVLPNYALFEEGMLFSQLLILVAYIDGKTQQIPNWTHSLIFVCGLAFLRAESVTDAAIGFILVSIPFLLISIITHEGIGLGDIKLMAACGFVLGSTRIFLAATLGMTLSGITHLFRPMERQNKNARYALAPYLAVGCFFAYLIPF